MRICYLANANMIHIQRWIKYFVERGHEVHIISFEPSDIKLNGINTHIVKTNKKLLYISFPYKFLQIRTIVEDIKPDIVHALDITKHGNIAPFLGFSPFVATALGSDIMIHAKKSKIFKKSAQLSLKRADLITCDGVNMKDAIINLGTPYQKIKIISHGVDIKMFNSPGRDKKVREELKLFDYPTIISIRSLWPLYDVESLIKSAPLVLKEIPDVKFIIAGEGEQKEYLMNLAKSLNLIDSIRFVGFITNDELPEYLASADVYVSTSLSDAGLAASTAEAMACELPVIITDFGDNRKWVEDGVSGFIVPLKDPKSLAERIIYLLKNPDIRKEFGMRNRKIIEERNNYYKEMEKMENIYIELIERYKS